MIWLGGHEVKTLGLREEEGAQVPMFPDSHPPSAPVCSDLF